MCNFIDCSIYPSRQADLRQCIALLAGCHAPSMPQVLADDDVDDEVALARRPARDSLGAGPPRPDTAASSPDSASLKFSQSFAEYVKEHRLFFKFKNIKNNGEEGKER